MPFQAAHRLTGTGIIRRLGRHNFRFGSTGTRTLALRPAVRGARYSAPGSPGRSYHRQSLWAETHSPGGILLSPPWKERSLLAPVSVFQFPVWTDAGRQAGRRGRQALSCSFFSRRWTRSFTCVRCMRSSCPPWTGHTVQQKYQTCVMRCRQQQSDESHPCSISSRSSRHARIPFHLNPSARPRYQTWTRSCWSFHDDRYDRARGISHSGGPL